MNKTVERGYLVNKTVERGYLETAGRIRQWEKVGKIGKLGESRLIDIGPQ